MFNTRERVGINCIPLYRLKSLDALQDRFLPPPPQNIKWAMIMHITFLSDVILSLDLPVKFIPLFRAIIKENGLYHYSSILLTFEVLFIMWPPLLT